ncbi:ribonuclease HI [Sphingomonas sp. AOB5]|uniref:ribonuclease HI n=1 Tax=Sphingomonas sp. AOB5 TaxID=3034017 RepID=UPI0023F6BE25|nr:RNase H family protein [Sphingomonas sp. AOB5]MDF7777874.1 ribonuclease HI [Sphingomonas sp. AOB5]
MPSRLKVFFDGGCRPNPGAMELAVVAGGRTHIRRDLGQGTSADAEWLALIHALEVAQAAGGAFVLMGDSANVIGQAGGTAKLRGAGLRHIDRFRVLAGSTPPPIRHIKRTQNLAGIALARLHDR